MIKEFNFFNKDSSLYNNFFHLKMKEGLIYSLDYDIFNNKLENLLKKYNVKFNIKIANEYVSLYIKLEKLNHKNFNKLIIDLINNCGYFISKLIDINSGKNIKSILESENEEFLFFFQKRFDIPKDLKGNLYHSTTEHYYNKIKGTGLSPKTQKMISNDLDRIYLSDNLEESIDFCTQKRFFYKQKYRNNNLFNMDINKWVVLEIDIFSIPDIKLYVDPKMDNSYYTYDFIPFYSIKIIKKLNFS